MRKIGSVPILVAILLVPGVAFSESCRVVDPELQGAYEGPCVNGLAEGVGHAQGTADYRGGFHAGMKQGKGVKTWPNGDRYEGEFNQDRKEGAGTYVFGKGPWQGERYEGAFRDDMRNGHGVYRWRTGDVYSGPWKDDVAVGPPTPMMQARAKFEQESRAAVGKPGVRVCSEAGSKWMRGEVAAADGDALSVRLDDGNVVAGSVTDWTPCY